MGKYIREMAIKIDGTSAIDKAILRRPRKSWLNTRAQLEQAGQIILHAV